MSDPSPAPSSPADSGTNTSLVSCPACGKCMQQDAVSVHLDAECPSANHPVPSSSSTQTNLASIFQKSANAKTKPPLQHRKRPSNSNGTQHPPSKRSKPSATTNTPSDRTDDLDQAIPLAESLRPTSLAEFTGQRHLLAPGEPFSLLLHNGRLGSIILWGPPGCGKTTLARLIAANSNSVFKELSATASGVPEVRAVVEEARKTRQLTKRKTLLFLDEIHRFNKAQQDVFLPYIEQGAIDLIGATTENPSFKVTSALMSRCRTYTLNALTEVEVYQMLRSALERMKIRCPEAEADPVLPDSSQTLVASQVETGTNSPRCVSDHLLRSIASYSDGDARTAISLLELALLTPDSVSDLHLLKTLRESVRVSFDRTGDPHYDTISALHKSVRGSDGNAALFWLARMLTAGEDPLFIARRLVVIASEDVGMANERALPLAVATMQACQLIGMPECRISLAHCVTYLAESPKSTRSYMAYTRAEAAAREYRTLPIPMNIRNAPTGLMKELGYGEGYNYDPSYRHPVHNEFLPPEIKEAVFLYPEGDKSDKQWDEALLVEWEKLKNNGDLWEGRLEEQ